MKSVLNYINTFGDKIIHIHWHDNHGRKDEHLPIGIVILFGAMATIHQVQASIFGSFGEGWDAAALVYGGQQ